MPDYTDKRTYMPVREYAEKLITLFIILIICFVLFLVVVAVDEALGWTNQIKTRLHELHQRIEEVDERLEQTAVLLEQLEKKTGKTE